MRKKRRWFTRIFCAVLCFSLIAALGSCFACTENFTTEVNATPANEAKTTDLPPAAQVPSGNTTLHRVAYIPIDNRPVNKERVEYLAQSVGIELLMPREELYRTVLDNMELNADGSTMGNREALCQWLLEMDEVCDHFIISLDQMTSGGLVSSRWLSNTDLSFEYEMIDTILALCQNNTVYVFDTVMRLASTVGYQGYQLDEYNAFRAYGRVERKILAEEALTLENIVSGYAYASNGNLITIDLPEEARASYHASRERKLKITDYFLRLAGDAPDFIYIGVDDSSPQNTIQTNEIQYIKALMGERGALSAATDELGLCCLARMASEFYGEAAVNVSYFGPGKDQPADGYDIGTLDESVRVHLSALSTTQNEEREEALQVLFLTYGSTNFHREDLMEKLKENQQEHIPTAVIDVSEQPQIFAEMLVGDDEIDLCQLLGYSSWNTAANAMGIALSQSTARYSYLRFMECSTAQANAGFLKAMTFSYIKDISYKCFCNNIEGLMNDDSACSVVRVIERINHGSLTISLKEFAVSSYGRVAVSDFRYPWNREFEMTFRIEVYEGKGK